MKWSGHGLIEPYCPADRVALLHTVGRSLCLDPGRIKGKRSRSGSKTRSHSQDSTTRSDVEFVALLAIEVRLHSLTLKKPTVTTTSDTNRHDCCDKVVTLLDLTSEVSFVHHKSSRRAMPVGVARMRWRINLGPINEASNHSAMISSILPGISASERIFSSGLRRGCRTSSSGSRRRARIPTAFAARKSLLRSSPTCSI